MPVELDIATAAVREPDTDALVKVLARLEFHSLAKRLTEAGAPAEATAAAVIDPAAAETPASTILPPAPVSSVRIVDRAEDLEALARTLRAAPIIAIDTETSSLEPHDAELLGISFAVDPDTAWYLPFGHRPRGGELAAPAPVTNLPALTDPALAPIAALLRDPAVKKAGHNIKYDWQVLRRAGVELKGVVYDSMLASFLLDPGRRSHGIDTLSLELLSRPMRSHDDLAGKGKTRIPFAEVAIADAAEYCGADSTTVLALHRLFSPGSPTRRCSRCSTDWRCRWSKCWPTWNGPASRSIPGSSAGWPPSSPSTCSGSRPRSRSRPGARSISTVPKQLAAVLFEKLQLPALKRTKSGPSTDADVLEQLAEMGHEVPRLLLEYRELEKLRSTYVDVLPRKIHRSTGRIHTSFNQIGAATGRLSSTDPNLQNIPVRSPRGEAIRRGFVPQPGWKFVVADYSQIELRLMAHLSLDPAFIEAFRQGQDIHRQTAAIIFDVPLADVTAEMRARAKTINFGTIYGQGPFALSKQLSIPQEEAKAFIAQYFRRFAGVRVFLDRQVEIARERGYVETLFGRRRYIPEVKDRNFNMRAFGERQAQNAPLQGSAADLIKIAMARIHGALRDGGFAARLLLQVHDELVLEAPAAEVERVAALVKEHMEGAASLEVPLVVDVGGDNWLDAKS